VAIAGVALLFVPPRLFVLNAFDEPGRLAWSCLALGLILFPGWRFPTVKAVRLSLLLLVWIVARTLVRDYPLREAEVLATWCLPVLLFVAASGIDAGAFRPKTLGRVLLVAGYIQALIMILQRFGHDPFFGATTSQIEYLPGRMIGTIGYHNQAVDFLVLTAIGALLCCRSVVSQLLVVSPLFITAVLTGYRGGLLAFGILFGLILKKALLKDSRLLRQTTADAAPETSLGLPYRYDRQPYRPVMAIIGAILLFLIALLLSMQPLDTRLSRTGILPQKSFHWSSPAVQSRLQMWQIALSMAADRPLFGWGAGEYAYQYLERLGQVLPENKPFAMLKSVVYAREAHNDFLQFLSEFGVVGVLLLCCILWLLWNHGNENISRRPSSEISALRCLLLAMLALTSLSFTWQTAVAGPLAGLLAGLLIARTSTPSRNTAPAHGRVRLGLGLVSIVLLAWFGWLNFLNLLYGQLMENPTQHNRKRVARFTPSWAYRHQALRGAVEVTHGDPAEGQRALEQAQKGFCDLFLWNNLGHVLARRGQWDGAVEIYRLWTKTGIDHVVALANLSIAFENRGDYQLAAETLYRKTRFWASPAAAEVQRLTTLFIKGRDYHAANHVIWQYHRSWRDEPPPVQALMHNLAGAAAMALHENERARAAFLQALELDPSLQSARQNLYLLDKRNP